MDVIRPSKCPNCGAASRRPGAPRQLHGHGCRSRQVRGPLSVDGEPRIWVIDVRRYRCSRCQKTCTVVPRGVLMRRYYSASAVALAMALYGVEHLSSVETRARVCAWRSTGPGHSSVWSTLKRWLRAVREERLFAFVRACPSEWSNRKVAERVATTLGAMAPPGMISRSWRERAFAGGQAM